MKPYTLLAAFSLVVLLGVNLHGGGLVEGQAYHYSQGWFPGRKRSTDTVPSSLHPPSFKTSRGHGDKLGPLDEEALKAAILDIYYKSSKLRLQPSSLLPSALQLVSRAIQVEVDRRLREALRRSGVDHPITAPASREAALVNWLENEDKNIAVEEALFQDEE